MTECQGCGAWNNTSRTLCVLCGTPLAEIDEWDAAAELPPLPPLPDGGLRASMPTWLRETSGLSIAETIPAARVVAEAATPDPVPLGPRADPRTFLTDDDFPQWLRDLATRREDAPHHATEPGALPPAAAWPVWAGWAAPAAIATDPIIVPPVTARALPEAAPVPEPTADPASDPGLDARRPAAVAVARALDERRGRDVWETLLLVLLFLGVIVAALWALVANGVFSPGA